MTIGSGIFRTPAQIAARVPDPLTMLAVWALGGAVTLCGALSIAELAASLPQAGGIYVFLREGWGRGTAFVFTWSELVLIRAAGLSGIATVFGEYFAALVRLRPRAASRQPPTTAPSPASWSPRLANVRGVQTGALMTGATSAAKFAALALIAWWPRSFSAAAASASAAHLAAGQAPVQRGTLRPGVHLGALGLRRLRAISRFSPAKSRIRNARCRAPSSPARWRSSPSI